MKTSTKTKPRSTKAAPVPALKIPETAPVRDEPATSGPLLGEGASVVGETLSLVVQEEPVPEILCILPVYVLDRDAFVADARALAARWAQKYADEVAGIQPADTARKARAEKTVRELSELRRQFTEATGNMPMFKPKARKPATKAAPVKRAGGAS